MPIDGCNSPDTPESVLLSIHPGDQYVLRTPPASAVEETEMHEIHRVGTGMHRISLIE
jgi:hypothetical protein